MRYLIRLKPLEAYLFGGDITFGKLLTENEKKEGSDEGTYLVHSRLFPQQSALLGMIRKEFMIQYGLLTRKKRGEWVDKKEKAIKLVGDQKFDIFATNPQDFGTIKSLSPIFVIKNKKRYIKQVDIDSYEYHDGLLKGYNPKENIYDNFVSLDSNEKLKTKDIFLPITQIGNKKGGDKNSLYKKTSYKLQDGFEFGFYLECDDQLKESIVKLGADDSKFKLTVEEVKEETLSREKKNYITLLSDAYIKDLDEKDCDFAITSEISFRSLKNKKHVNKKKYNNPFEKSKKTYLYEKGSVFLNPKDSLIKKLNTKNLQKIGYNIYI